jgi:hypothetical protein
MLELGTKVRYAGRDAVIVAALWSVRPNMISCFPTPVRSSPTFLGAAST